ncbi:MAG: UDP-N-acetylmuramoyl-L-alanyl-D-glutamate--2,6-diaminopimelate ligase, partial [Desulfobacterales bacterium]
MKLSNLLQTIDPVSVNGTRLERKDEGTDRKTTKVDPSNMAAFSFSPDPEIVSIHYRSQDVKPGGLFVAIQGLAADGHDFIDEALNRGASAVVTQKALRKDSIIIEVESTRKALASISSQFYSAPSEELFLIGITGTNGKTTTALLIEHLLAEAGMKVGVIGTLNYRYSGKIFKNPMTTPESLDLQKILAEMVSAGITHVVMEVTSHAIDLDRIYGCRFGLRIFTNLSQDHLDYHGDMNTYWSCKKRLFNEISSDENKNERILAVLNCNDEKGQELVELLEGKFGKSSVISVGFSNDNHIRPQGFQHDLNGITGIVSTPLGSVELKSHLVGPYNFENILCAVGTGVALDLSLTTIKAGIETVAAVPGRLERIKNETGRFVYVDYAHTPDALENVLSTLSLSAEGKVICVFGCGGDRDKTKRPLMGQIVAEFCDLSIITSDNPRTEQPMEIINEIILGTQNVTSHAYKPSALDKGFEKKGYIVEPDRKRAIKLAISLARPKDIVLIAGKGDETYQIIGNHTTTFDDREEARAALLELAAPKSDLKIPNTPKAGHLRLKAKNPKTFDLSPIPWTTREILEATGGELICGDESHSFSNISIDSRKILTDELFVAIQGDVHDGHRFVDDVLDYGVKGCLISKNRVDRLSGKQGIDGDVVCVGVKNTTKALGDLAAFNRRRTSVSVVGITGSNGKTSTRRMTAGVVSSRFCTLSTRGNLNNEIGLPLMLLKLSHDHEWAVLEMGMNRPGEIARLAEICSPDIGVITNIGPAHLEGLGSLDAVMKAKGELLGKIKPSGTAVLNADDPRVLHLASDVSVNVLLYGFSEKADIRSQAVNEHGEGTSFTLLLPTAGIYIELKTPAGFMVSNALAAAAVGYCMGLTEKEIKDGLEDFEPVKGRMNVVETRKGINIIDDTYNANPASMEAAIKALKTLKKRSRGILVAGDMLELGDHAESLHRQIGLM